MNVIPYGKQEITAEDILAVTEVLKSDFLTQGPMVDKFEKEFGQFINSQNCIAVTNGTAALHLAAMALGVQPGDRVLVTPNTFVASANCIRYCGGEVEFVDIDDESLCLDLNLLEKKLESHPRGYYKGLVCVDFAGYPVDFQVLRKLADKHGLWIIEDACHALGAEFLNDQGKWIKSGSGQYADVSVFSFHPVKHLATGEGGMISTANSELAQKMRTLRTHGIVKDPSLLEENHGGWYYEMQELGYNYRISDILCALGVSQLKRIEVNLSARRAIANRYMDNLSATPLVLPKLNERIRHAYHLFVVRTNQRSELYSYLKSKNIYAQVHYIPVHTQPYYVKRYGRQSLPKMEKYYSEAISLPMYHSMSPDQQGQVIDEVRSFFA